MKKIGRKEKEKKENKFRKDGKLNANVNHFLGLFPSTRKDSISIGLRTVAGAVMES